MRYEPGGLSFNMRTILLNLYDGHGLGNNFTGLPLCLQALKRRKLLTRRRGEWVLTGQGVKQARSLKLSKMDLTK